MEERNQNVMKNTEKSIDSDSGENDQIASRNGMKKLKGFREIERTDR
jgi:hypothetical protein